MASENVKVKRDVGRIGGWGGGVRLMASENFMTIYHCSVCILVIFGKK